MMKRRRGFIQLAILHLLKENSMHGYQIMKKLKENSDGLYAASAGTVYPALQELLDQKMVDLHVEGDKKVYSMNENGKERLGQYEMNGEGDFWVKWRERLVWKKSKEAVELKSAVEQWELELRKTIRLISGKPERAIQLTDFLQEITEKIKKDYC
jgi:DNA-binding PadR family transcriptional regulator